MVTGSHEPWRVIDVTADGYPSQLSFRFTMKNDNAQSASTDSAPISDAEMSAVLANSNWARMERAAKNFAAIQEVREENCCQDRCADMTDGADIGWRR